MKKEYAILFALLALAVLFCGCTSQPAQPPPVTPPASTAVATAAPTISGPTVTGTAWKLGWYDDTKGVWSKVIQDSTITATFGIDGVLRGSGGCNPYSTDYQFGDAPRIWIRRPIVPETLCQTPTGVMKQEGQYFTDIEWAETYKVENNQLLLFDKTGKKILQFDPA